MVDKKFMERFWFNAFDIGVVVTDQYSFNKLKSLHRK